MMRSAILLALLAAGTPQAAPVQRIPAPEARQGVAVDDRHAYAVSNAAIGKYDKRSGKRVDRWEGDPAHFRHMNSCTAIAGTLYCAASNYPDAPHHSMVEMFATDPLRHLRTVPLNGFPGSLTVFNRHDGRWWAIFANYDGRGGAPGRDHRDTLLVELDDALREIRRFRFPDTILERFAPRSCSGGAWGADDLLYVTGHDRPELYALRIPARGDTLEHVATYAIPTNGQAIDWDPARPWHLWSIERDRAEMVESRINRARRSGSRESR